MNSNIYKKEINKKNFSLKKKTLKKLFASILVGLGDTMFIS